MKLVYEANWNTYEEWGGSVSMKMNTNVFM